MVGRSAENPYTWDEKKHIESQLPKIQKEKVWPFRQNANVKTEKANLRFKQTLQKIRDKMIKDSNTIRPGQPDMLSRAHQFMNSRPIYDPKYRVKVPDGLDKQIIWELDQYEKQYKKHG